MTRAVSVSEANTVDYGETPHKTRSRRGPPSRSSWRAVRLLLRSCLQDNWSQARHRQVEKSSLVSSASQGPLRGAGGRGGEGSAAMLR